MSNESVRAGAVAKRVLMPLPSRDFDPTEAGVAWKILRERGHEVSFATPDARPAEPDPVMMTGEGLDLWSRLPVIGRLRFVGAFLGADRRGREACDAMCRDARYRTPLAWSAADAADFDGVLLPGGHWARGIREYLESEVLQRLIASFFAMDRAVGAICHGVVVAARAVDPATGRSVLHGRRTTALTWEFESKADSIARITRFWDPTYYRTYPEEPGEARGFRSVEAEVTRALASPDDFLNVPPDDPARRLKTGGLVRDRPEDLRAAFVVRDGRYVSARWPGDAHAFAIAFANVLEGGVARDGGASGGALEEGAGGDSAVGNNAVGDSAPGASSSR